MPSFRSVVADYTYRRMELSRMVELGKWRAALEPVDHIYQPAWATPVTCSGFGGIGGRAERPPNLGSCSHPAQETVVPNTSTANLFTRGTSALKTTQSR